MVPGRVVKGYLNTLKRSFLKLTNAVTVGINPCFEVKLLRPHGIADTYGGRLYYARNDQEWDDDQKLNQDQFLHATSLYLAVGLAKRFSLPYQTSRSW
jgi:hypothetical protein